MIRDEMLKLCKVCKNREVDLKRGMICKLTGAYADFSENCPNYDYDEQEDRRLSAEQENVVKTEKIGGWLGFFLFQICAGILVNLILVFTSQWPEDVAVYYILQGLIIIPYMLMGVSTVYAFIRRKANAVFWGYAYLLLSLIINILSLLYGYESNILSLLHGYESMNTMTSLVWNVIWSVFFILSDNVKTLIPKETRRVTTVDWVLAAIGVMIPSIVCMVVCSLAWMA